MIGIEKLVASAQAHSSDDSCPPEATLSDEQDLPLPGDPPTSNPVPEDAGADGEVIDKTASSSMFPLDGPAAFEEADKLSFPANAFQASWTRGFYTDKGIKLSIALSYIGGVYDWVQESEQ
ncbi:hypothetical protein B0J13DRAFT_523737 [Dactylonectria estremocensis]|uniref:Uncharacterized protein n=1 Tax=Dactylonectria estremocensis TaxID=1079267 RepID=A0A9P9J408_9HYPO|nr:hypothetical protein B0J13DRAFT_523737 [Dactylonectria estremocensis]